MSEHPLNIEVENYDQWVALVQERNTLRAELERIKRVNQLIAERAAHAEAERDAARAAAKRYKRRAHLLYRTWCGYWGTPVDWDFLRTALYDPEVRDE